MTLNASLRKNLQWLEFHLKNFRNVKHKITACISIINLFLVNVTNLYPLKTPENPRFSGVFRIYKMRTLAIIVLLRKQQTNRTIGNEN